jgi:4-alpha-glucanotransferase
VNVSTPPPGRGSTPPSRASGILLHPSSLPGPAGIGDMGPSALRFLDWLEEAGQSLWQVLPLGPTGYGDSPYASFSSFAGNPLLVSPEGLASWALMDPSDLDSPHSLPPDRVDYGAVITWKMPLLRRAAARFLARGPAELRRRFDAFRSTESHWLDDYALFMGIKARHPGAWNRDWPTCLALREATAIARFRKELAGEMEIERVVQFLFFTQWDALRAEAARRGISIIGDLPIFVAPDSVDVWAHRGLFLLDADGRPTVVSGVPPDYFSATGQLWGNPLYDWEALARDGYRFWVERIRAARRMVDIVRVDHFRGFTASWTVPAAASTAAEGRWVSVPGRALFETLEKELGALPIIAEDLGVITPDVAALRDRFGFPGMRILQFAFDRNESGALGPANRFLPHNHAEDSVVYTGTHDNDTTAGWYSGRAPEERAAVERYAPFTEPEISWRFIRMAMGSVCRWAIVPLQDVLGLGSGSRMNTPGTVGAANWSWRAPADAFSTPASRRLRELAGVYGRLPPA